MNNKYLFAGCPLFSGLGPKHEEVLLTHGDSVDRLATDLEVVGMSGATVAAFQHKDLPIYGVQFHPEVDLTVNGRRMIRNFLYQVTVTPRLTNMDPFPFPLPH